MKFISMFLSLRVLFIFAFNLATISSFASWTTVTAPSAKADKASAELRSLGKNIRIEKIVKLSEQFVSPKEFEKLMKDIQKSKNVNVESLMYGDDFFYLKSGPIKIVFKWIDKKNVAFKLNGHTFSYADAANAELWQKKVLEVVKNYQKPKAAFSKNALEFFNANAATTLPSKFVVNMGTGFMTLPILYQLFHPESADAFEMLSNINSRINWKSPWLWTGIAAVVITLIANHYYKKHKEKHEDNKSDINARLKVARANLDAAEKAGEENLVAYQQDVNDLENLKSEYRSSSDVGFFGFLFGNRMKEPALYDTIMDRTSSSSGGNDYDDGGPGSPMAPPTSGSAADTEAVY